MLIKYIKSVLWRVAKRLSYIEDALCPKVKHPVQRRVKARLLTVSGPDKTVFSKLKKKYSSEGQICFAVFSESEELKCDGFRGPVKSGYAGRKISSKFRASLGCANKGSLHDHTRQG